MSESEGRRERERAGVGGRVENKGGRRKGRKRGRRRGIETRAHEIAALSTFVLSLIIPRVRYLDVEISRGDLTRKGDSWQTFVSSYDSDYRNIGRGNWNNESFAYSPVSLYSKAF